MIAAVVALGVAAGGGYLLHRPAPPLPSGVPAAGTASDELADLRSHVGNLERAVQADQARLALLQRGSPDSEPPIPAHRETGAAAGEGRPPLSPEEARARNGRVVQRIAARLESEQRDRSWAPAYEDSLREAVTASAEGGAAPTVEAVSCRTSVCRLDLSYATAEAQMKFLQAFPAHRPAMTAAHWHNAPASDGAPRTTIELVREGYPIPGTEDAQD
jgi:hypothetical protein